MTDIAPPARSAGLRGLLPQRQGADRFAIRWVHEYAPLPTAIYPVDVSQTITDWGMLGNGPDPTLTANNGQPCGDCFFAAYNHDRMLAGTTVDSNGTVTLYFRYDNGQDVGVVLADALRWLYEQKMIEAFAPVHPGSVDAVMQTFKRGVLVGASLTDDADQRFTDHEEWTTSGGQRPDPQEGHCVLRVKAQANGTVTVVTWGADQDADAGWVQACEQEHWIVLTRDDEAVLGAEAWAALIADLDALPGSVHPQPVTPPLHPPTPPDPTPPAPAPQPTPPAPDPESLLKRVEHEVTEVIEDVEELIDELTGRGDVDPDPTARMRPVPDPQDSGPVGTAHYEGLA